MADETKITPEIVKQRAALAGISLDEDRLEDIATTMEAASRNGTSPPPQGAGVMPSPVWNSRR